MVSEGKFIFIFLYGLHNSRSQCLNSKNHTLPGNFGSNTRYRSCDHFRWRDDLGRMDPNWVDEVCSKSTLGTGANVQEDDGRSNGCQGAACAARKRPRVGNRSCSNGRSCRYCCERAQHSGAPECRYSSHNILSQNMFNIPVSRLFLPRSLISQTYITFLEDVFPHKLLSAITLPNYF